MKQFAIRGNPNFMYVSTFSARTLEDAMMALTMSISPSGRGVYRDGTGKNVALYSFDPADCDKDCTIIEFADGKLKTSGTGGSCRVGKSDQWGRIDEKTDPRYPELVRQAQQEKKQAQQEKHAAAKKKAQGLVQDLRQLLEKYNASIGFTCDLYSDTHITGGSIVVDVDDVSIIESGGWWLTYSDLKD